MKRIIIAATMVLASTLLCKQERIYVSHKCSWEMCPLQSDGVTMEDISDPVTDAQCFYRSHYDHPELNPEECERRIWY